MNGSIFFSIFCASVLVFISTAANAVLIDRGGGMIYDSETNLTWLQNANYAITTLTDDRVDEIILAVGSVDGVTLKTNDFKFYRNGKPYEKLSWRGATAVVDQLVFGGFDDWRLPATPQQDPTCIEIAPNIDYLKYAWCTGGEMGNLFYNSLGNDRERPFNYHPFFNVSGIRYWTSTRFDPTLEWTSITTANIPPNDAYHWTFYMDPGTKYVMGDGNGGFAWPVRDNCGFNIDLAANTWTMFGLPCGPVETVNNVESVFGDDLDIAQYGIRWVVYEWDADADSYSRLFLTSTLSQNKGYWILSLDAANVDAKGDDTGVVVSNECAVPQGCYEIPLAPPASGETEQYNMIGHAFPGTIPWKDARIKVGGSVYTPSQAQSANIMDKTIWLYNGNAYDSYDDITAGLEGQLVAFDGFWIRTLQNASSDTTLLLPKVPVTP